VPARVLWVVLGLGVLLLVACGGDSDSNDNPATSVPSAFESAVCGPQRAHEPGEFDETITSSGIERSYILHVPPGYDGSTRTPLVVLLHGSGGSGPGVLAYTHFGEVSDEHDFILVAPTAQRAVPVWNVFQLPDEADDVVFLNDLLDHLGAELCIDAQRTFVAGYSNGGGMTMRLACDDASRFRAVGLNAAVYIDCTPRLPVIAFHGNLDYTLPINGGSNDGVLYPSVHDKIASWAATLACSPDAAVTRPTAHIELSAYHGCAQGDGAVQFYVIEFGGHTWPGAYPGSRGGSAALTAEQLEALTTQEIDASQIIWQFFSER
jgi:polyhydroxybutyrate depolymerase